MLMPSLALRTAAFKPLICAVMFSRTDKPAASSDAWLMRLPVDKLSIVERIERPFCTSALVEIIALTLVLMTVDISLLQKLKHQTRTSLPQDPCLRPSQVPHLAVPTRKFLVTL